jgi:polysaccharide export outer membrane protein
MKRTTKTHLAAVAVLACLLGAGEAGQAQATQQNDYVIGPQDVLAIQLLDQPELGGKYTVEADGTFGFPLVGRIVAAGRTLRQVETDLRAKLADGYFRNPQLSIAVDQYKSQTILVMGEVRSAGAVTLTGGMSLLEALALARGAPPVRLGGTRRDLPCDAG